MNDHVGTTTVPRGGTPAKHSVASSGTVQYSTCAMGHIPLPTAVIALAMLSFSIVIVSKLGGKIPLTSRARVTLLLVGVAALSAGVYLHLTETTLPTPAPANGNQTGKIERKAFEFTFTPAQARWGDEVAIEVPFSAESVTVYLNGMPLPKRLRNDGRTIRVTVPSGAKTGYLELEREGVRARASSSLLISP